MNRLYVSMAAGEPKAIVVNALNELRFYASQHFDEEEAPLARVGYPGLEAHCAQHGYFIAQLESFDVRKPKAHDALAFLKDWFLKHVLGTDRTSQEWLRQA
jgi:hemerythrin-like metal-binding protein